MRLSAVGIVVFAKSGGLHSHFRASDREPNRNALWSAGKSKAEASRADRPLGLGNASWISRGGRRGVFDQNSL